MQYKKVIADRDFLHKFLSIIPSEYEVRDIEVTGEIEECKGPNLDDLLEMFQEQRKPIKTIAISAWEPWKKDEEGETDYTYEKNYISLRVDKESVWVHIVGKEIAWVNGIEKTVEGILNRGTWYYRLTRNATLSFIFPSLALWSCMFAVLLLSRKSEAAKVAGFVLTGIAVVIVILAVILAKNYFKGGVTINTGSLEDFRAQQRITPGQWKIIIWGGIIAFVYTLLVAVIVKLIFP
jgi:hypothetical protein